MSIPGVDHLRSSEQALAKLHGLCSSLRLNMALEKRAQSDLEIALRAAEVDFDREKPLSPADIPDFLVRIDGITIALELKTRARRKSIYNQLERYAVHDNVQALLLMTATPMGLPPTISGKPAAVVSMGGGWL